MSEATVDPKLLQGAPFFARLSPEDLEGILRVGGSRLVGIDHEASRLQAWCFEVGHLEGERGHGPLSPREQQAHVQRVTAGLQGQAPGRDQRSVLAKAGTEGFLGHRRRGTRRRHSLDGHRARDTGAAALRRLAADEPRGVGQARLRAQKQLWLDRDGEIASARLEERARGAG
jgi:hypothetical protein